MPSSGRFEDVYFSGDGIAETRQVFLDGIGAPDIWAGRQHFNVGETGFGSGLNFLSLWQAWRQSVPPDARLDYVAVEAFPMQTADMARIHGAFGALSEALVCNLPPALSGCHQVILDGGRVRLLLLYGDAREMLSGLEAKIDAWFLDGFAPSKNPDMWSAEVFREIGRLTKPDGRLATFTAAGAVRRGLEEVGFEMQRRPGFGAKRECLAGRFTSLTDAVDPTPWFAAPQLVPTGGDVAVIGGGIAGCCIARSLAGRDFSPTIFDAADGFAGGASGTPAAVVQPRPYTSEDANGWFHAAAHRDAVKLYDELDGAWLHRGLLAVGRDGPDAERFQHFAESGIAAGAEWLDPAAASERVGVPLSIGGAWFPTAGTLNTTAVCNAIAQGISFSAGTRITGLEPVEAGCRLLTADGASPGTFSAVVLAGGHAVRQLPEVGELELVANRGQVTRQPPSPVSKRQTAPISYGGYLTPPSADHIMGSSFERIDDLDAVDWRAPSDADDAANLAILAARLPETAAGMSEPADAWVGMRGTTQDRMPFVGALPDRAAYETAYADLHHGRRYQAFPPAPYQPNLFILSGLGARGFLTAPLTAEIMAAQMSGSPVPQPKTVLNAIHPARFLIRDLKRRRARATITPRCNTRED